MVQAAILWVILLLIFSPLPAQAKEARQSGTNEDKAESSGMQEDLIGEFDFGEIDDSLKELFPEEKLDFKETLMGVISGDLTFSAQLLNRLVSDQLGYAFRSCKDNLVHILLIAVIAAVFSNFSNVFQSRQISEISFYALYRIGIKFIPGGGGVGRPGDRQPDLIHGRILPLIFPGSGNCKRQRYFHCVL